MRKNVKIISAVLAVSMMVNLTACTKADAIEVLEAGQLFLEAEQKELEGSTVPEVEREPVIAEGLPEFSVKGGTDLPGNFYLSFPYSRNLIMLDGKGNIVWSKHEDQPQDGSVVGWWDFKKHVVNGETYYSYHDYTGGYDNFNMDGFGPGERVILDSDFNEIKRITLEESDTVEKGHPVDGHDFYMFDPDHYILSGYIKERVYNIPGYPEGSNVVGSYLQEVDNGKVVWDWKSTDYPELYALTVDYGDPTADDFANKNTDAPDYVHFNSMQVDKNGDLIVSLRHLSTIACLDRSKDKDQIKWKLSGAADDFGLAEEQKTCCQHYAYLDGDYITAFDNENISGLTRICSYKPNTETHKVDIFRSFRIGGKNSSACGDVRRIKDEIYVIGWGRTENDAVCMSVMDLTSGEEFMSIELDKPKNFTYRCVYCE